MKAIYTTCLLLLTSFLIQSQNTTIPDSNFEQRLIDLGYDSGMVDGIVPTVNISSITQLFVPNSSISDLTGIEDFADLELLDCIGNPITILDLSSNAFLKHLYTGTNQIASINVSNNFALETLICTGNQLTTLDLSNNLALKTLSCQTGLISSLDLSNNLALESLNCSNNLISSLNLRNGNNAILTTMRAENNSLTCVEVDNETDANAGSGSYSSWQVDGGVLYSENCGGCPEIDVLGNSVSISSGDNTPNVSDGTDFGTVNFSEFLDRTFTIENTGTQDLNLIGTPIIEVTNSVDFTIVSNPTTLISSGGGTTTFVIRYTPSMAGTINTATLSIENDDCDENPYVFDLRGQSSTLGLEESNLLNQISIYPNPNKGIFSIKADDNLFINHVKLYNLNGKLIKVINPSNIRYENIQINVPQGIYFLKITSDAKAFIKKILVI